MSVPSKRRCPTVLTTGGAGRRIRFPSTYPPETAVNARHSSGRVGGVRDTGFLVNQRESAASGNDRQGPVPLRLIQGVAGSNPVSPTDRPRKSKGFRGRKCLEI